jgi:hypothetical protein
MSCNSCYSWVFSTMKGFKPSTNQNSTEVKPLPDSLPADLIREIFDHCPDSHLSMARVVSNELNEQLKIKEIKAITDTIKRSWGSYIDSDGSQIIDMLTELNIISKTKIQNEEGCIKIKILNVTCEEFVEINKKLDNINKNNRLNWDNSSKRQLIMLIDYNDVTITDRL